MDSPRILVDSGLACRAGCRRQVTRPSRPNNVMVPGARDGYAPPNASHTSSSPCRDGYIFQFELHVALVVQPLPRESGNNEQNHHDLIRPYDGETGGEDEPDRNRKRGRQQCDRRPLPGIFHVIQQYKFETDADDAERQHDQDESTERTGIVLRNPTGWLRMSHVTRLSCVKPRASNLQNSVCFTSGARMSGVSLATRFTRSLTGTDFIGPFVGRGNDLLKRFHGRHRGRAIR